MKQEFFFSRFSKCFSVFLSKVELVSCCLADFASQWHLNLFTALSLEVHFRRQPNRLAGLEWLARLQCPLVNLLTWWQFRMVVKSELVSGPVAKQPLGFCWPWHSSTERSPADVSLWAGKWCCVFPWAVSMCAVSHQATWCSSLTAALGTSSYDSCCQWWNGCLERVWPRFLLHFAAVNTWLVSEVGMWYTYKRWWSTSCCPAGQNNGVDTHPHLGWLNVQLWFFQTFLSFLLKTEYQVPSNLAEPWC